MRAFTRGGGLSMAAILYFAVCNQCLSETGDHERVLMLERKVAKLEALLKNMSAAEHAAVPAKARKTKSFKASETTEDAKETSHSVSLAAKTDYSLPSGSPAPAPKDGAHSEGDPVGVGQPGDAPQELFVLRENSVTLKPTAWEVYSDLSYLSRIGLLQTDRAVLGSTSIRYGVLDWLELSANVPYGNALRASQLAPGEQASYDVKGFGDSSVQANVRLLQQSQNWPGVVLSVGAIIPTGPNPYSFAGYALDSPNAVATPNPTDVLRDYFSVGAWGIHSNLQFYKTVDPVILFFGGGADYLFGDAVDSYYVRQGVRYNYNAGFSLALSEKTTLGFSINGTYQCNLYVNGRTVPQSSREPNLARLSVIQRVEKNLFIEPSVAFGLNSDLPNTQFDLGVRAQF